MNTKDLINEILLPLKLIIPQPIIKRIPGLTTNEDIRVEQVFRAISPDMNCMAMGCGDDKLLKMHKERGGSGIGVDVHPWKSVDLLVEDSSDLPLEDKTFDCVTFVGCFNHIPGRIETLREAGRVLKDDGIVLITSLTPKLSAFWHKAIFWDYDQNERGMKEGEVYGFTHEEFCSCIKEAGFKIVDRKRFSWGMNNLYICGKAS